VNRFHCSNAWLAAAGPLLAVLLMSGGAPAFAAGTPPNGAEVYRQNCAKCHGKKGEGVKGKYDDALHGDWSLEKLVRVIEKTMPEDDPDKVNGPEVEAVARYIHDAFYSREARARNHPARVELVRLTNRQYVNTLADLLGGFLAQDAPPKGERGLRVNYRGSRRNRGGERVDRAVDFDFLREGADPAAPLTNEFAATWRGSVVAAESGDYEFILKTPNGARLWVNDDDRPLIDAGVASGDVTEHKASLRLLGGWRYPLRLEWSKAAKDKRASVSLQWKPPHGAQETIPARHLSTASAAVTFVLTTPFPPDDSSVGYERGVSISKEWDEATTAAAIEAANWVEQRLDAFSRSKPRDADRAAKAKAFCEDFVARAFRRPLTPEQKRIHIEAIFKGAARPEEAAKRVVMLALKSPRFLYLGLEAAQPDAHEVASRLSYGLWDSLPDAELSKAAREGALATREQVEAQARRMLGDARAHAKMQAFLHHWLQMNHAEDLSKDTKLFPGFSPEVIADLRASLNIFLDDVVWSGGSDYRRLLLEDDLFVNERLARFYGIATTNAADDFVKVSLDPKQRSGVLTHPYLLAAFSYPKSSSPIHRGVFLTRNIVGRALKPPPMAVAFKDSDFAPDLTMRQKVEELTRPTACQGCHSVINPLGFSLEHYDAVGRFRTKDGNRPVDAASDYTTDDGSVVKLRGARDVAEFAARSEHAQEAFIEQLFHQIVKQPLLAYGADTQDRLRESFVASGFNIQKLVVEIATTAALHHPQKSASSRKKS
jgi:hypothetical protein